jgi:hypothetical protein
MCVGYNDAGGNEVVITSADLKMLRLDDDDGHIWTVATITYYESARSRRTSRT